MKLTKSQLKQVIKEELALVLEKGFGQGTPPSGEFYKKQEIVLEEEDDTLLQEESCVECFVRKWRENGGFVSGRRLGDVDSARAHAQTVCGAGSKCS